MTNDQFSSDDLRFLHHKARLRNLRARNQKRSTAWVICGLLAFIVGMIWRGVLG
jgi:hypothetical protein